MVNGRQLLTLIMHRKSIIIGKMCAWYQPFENGLNAPQTEVYMHEMPGQYSNPQQKR